MKHGLVVVMSTVAVLTAAATAQGQGRGMPSAPACTTVQCDVLGDWGRTYGLLIGEAEAMPRMNAVQAHAAAGVSASD